MHGLEITATQLLYGAVPITENLISLLSQGYDRGGGGHSRGIGGGLGQRETVGGASQGTAGRSGMSDEVLAELERDIKADLVRWGCEEVAALLEPDPAEDEIEE